MSLKYKDREVISQSKAPESFGSTFWTSPQKEWNWPPVPEFDKLPYTVEERDGRLIMTSEPSPRLKYRVRKEFTVGTDPVPALTPHPSMDNGQWSMVTSHLSPLNVTYSIINESDETRRVAPWEITRVENNGGWIFFDAPADGITPAGLMAFEPKAGAVWYTPDETGENRKINADGHGWLAYYNNGLLLLKTFQDLQPADPAPEEAEIQVYVNRGKTYIELESQGAYTTLAPKEQLTWTVHWYLLPIEESPSQEQLMEIVNGIIR